MGSTDYQFVRLNEENVKDLIPLYWQVFKRRFSVEEIRAKYMNTHSGIRAQGHFALHQGKAVAFHGAIPFIMEYKGQKELSAQYGDAMTTKAHAGKGMFTRLGELTDAALQELGVRFVWGFPNQNSEYGYVNKLHWEGEERMRAFIFPIKGIASEQLLRKSGMLADFSQKRIKKILAPMLVEKTAMGSIDTQSKSGGVCRSQDFYDYKSFTPNYQIDLNGTRVWIKPLGGLLVGDIEIKDEPQLLQSVAELKELAARLGLHQLVLQASPNSELGKLLSQHFDYIDSWLIGYKSFNSQLPLDQLQFTYGDLDTF